jgi:hypothetical protein
MKKIFVLPLLIFAALVVLASNGFAQEILFSDNFAGSTVDTNKWTVTSYGGGFVTQGEGSLTFNHPNFQDGAFVTSTIGFAEPYKVTSSFRPDPDYSINGIVIRASGAYQPTWFYDPYGLNVAFFFGTYMTVGLNTPSGYTELTNVPVSFDVTQWNTFSVSDFGTSISVMLNDVLIVEELAVDPAFAIGDKLILADSDNGGLSGDIEASSFGPVTVEAVPEPSTYALLLLSGAASLWALKRRKS